MRLNHGGQASLIDRDGMSRLVTAKHNLMSKKLKCGTVVSCNDTFFCLQGPHSSRWRIAFCDMNCSQPVEDLPLRDEATWKSGIDILWGQTITVENLGQTRYDYISSNIVEMVDADFE
jgi:hypothetical protein